MGDVVHRWRQTKEHRWCKNVFTVSKKCECKWKGDWFSIQWTWFGGVLLVVLALARNVWITGYLIALLNHIYLVRTRQLGRLNGLKKIFCLWTIGVANGLLLFFVSVDSIIKQASGTRARTHTYTYKSMSCRKSLTLHIDTCYIQFGLLWFHPKEW